MAESAHIAFLSRTARREIDVTEFGPPGGGYALARIEDWPSGCTSWATVGLARLRYSSYRGLDLGWELVLTLEAATEQADLAVETLRAVVLEEDRRARERTRRPIVEANGLWAPGYSPHLGFTDCLAVPKLQGYKKIGGRYVSFQHAVPIGDRELRAYDRAPGDFVLALTADDIVRYPRAVD